MIARDYPFLTQQQTNSISQTKVVLPQKTSDT